MKTTKYRAVHNLKWPAGEIPAGAVFETWSGRAQPAAIREFIQAGALVAADETEDVSFDYASVASTAEETNVKSDETPPDDADSSGGNALVDSFADVREAIDGLDLRTGYTKSGKPTTEALSAALEREISGAGRDQLWEAYQAVEKSKA